MKDLINTPITLPQVSLDHIPQDKLPELAKNVKSFLDFTGAATNRSTHYNTKEEQREAEIKLHKTIFDVDRSIYGLLMLLPGVTDHSIMRACMVLLGNRWNSKASILPFEKEKIIIDRLVKTLPPQRAIKLFKEFSVKRINNTRTRKQILTYILNSDSLEYWAVKYRKKLRAILTHCWGKKNTGIIKSILSVRREWDKTQKEGILCSDMIDNYIDFSYGIRAGGKELKKVHDCVSFILGNDNTSMPLFKAFKDSKEDITQGKKLPVETLQGLRSTYHKEVTQKELLELVKKTLTKTQKKNVQKKAKEAGVEVEFDPISYSLVELYIYAFEMGMTDEILQAINAKAKKIAKSLPFRFEKVGILLDDSYSMSGSEEQKLRPMAMALALKQVIKYTAVNYYIKRTQTPFMERNGTLSETLPRPSGDTNPAEGLLCLLEQEPDSIFILSDGYENAPAERLAEVLSLVRKIGNHTPVYHINPVVAAESKKAVKQLANDIPVLTVSNPEQLGLIMMRSMLDKDPKRGILSLIGMTLHLID